MAVDTSANVFYNDNEIGLSKFIAPREKRKVPNHLLDTKIYASVCDNDIFHCRPSSIHFQGFEAGRKYTQTFRIINASSECQRMHVIPPSSDVFRIKYNKSDSLVPGMYLEVSVEFTPQENMYHCDSIRIHSKACQNLIIPIHAYLSMDVTSFPNNIHFKPTQVGQSSIKKIPLKNDAAIDFNFKIAFIKNHSPFDVQPLSGIVPANKHIDILIKYSPSEYCTSCANIQITVYQFNCQPYYCSITGTSEPGIATKMKVKEIEKVSKEIVDPRVVSPLGRSRAKKHSDSVKLPKKVEEKEIMKDGIRFPINLNGHSAVSYVLSQQAGKMRAKDVKDMVKGQTSSTCSSKQMKEAIFEHLVSKNVTEEQRNQLRWGVKLGEDSMSDLYHKDVLKERDKVWKEYEINRGECDATLEYSRSMAEASNTKVRRQVNEQALCCPTFDLFLNDDWQKRHRFMGKFIKAARKIIWISRATRSLKLMSGYLEDWRHGKFKNTRRVIGTPAEESREKQIIDKVSLETIGRNIQPFSFPEYIDPNQKDDMTVDALGVLPIRETAIGQKTKIGLYDLKVPLQYKLLHYNAHPSSNTVCKYIPKKLARTLRTGAEIEITHADYPSDVSTLESEELQEIDLTTTTTASQLTVPSTFLQPKIYHPMHIFNPLPGVHAHPQRLPYSEIDDDYSLSPLTPSLPKKLDREGVIPGVMNWKRFPLQGLVAMHSPSLYNVYVPRWSDPFGEELVASNPPPLLDSLPAEDKVEFMEQEEFSDVVVPTMNMIQAEFKMVEHLMAKTEDSETFKPFSTSMTLPTTNNPQSKFGMVSRDEVIKDLDLFLRKRMDNLGSRLKSRTEEMKSSWDLDNLYK